ncbi:MAG: DUF4339 domain-containing protein [Actinobacteria bacterium]|nr:DUF4339 domain-containing protein [Actinomycetota bacterium]
MSLDAGSGWYYSKLGGPPGEQVGPVSWEELVSLARSGLVASDDLIRSEQRAEWHPAGHLPGLFSPAAPSVLPSVPPSVPPSYAYPPPAPPVAAAAAPAPAGRSRLLLWLIPVIVVVLIGAGLGAYFGIWYGAGSSVTSALEELAFFQREGDILLEPVGSAGPGSFTGEEFVTAAPTTSLSIPNPAVTLPPITATPTSGAQSSTSSGVTQSTTTPTVAAQPVVLASYPGDTPALYGGSKSKLIADKEQELAYLERNPLKARAFCEALNSDPTLRWSGGTTVSPSQLRDYFAELTPLLLTRDTRVTNYGYRNGHPTPRQSVLQAGQLVLVDRYGVPRKRCECGNPLTPPIASRRPPTYTGPRWPTFNPQTVIIIQQTTVVINNFTVININTGETFGRPPGTNGGSDGPPPSTPATSGGGGTTPGSGGTSGTTGPPATGASGGATTTTGQVSAWRLEVMMRRSDAESKREMSINWEAEITINPDGSLKGTGPGGWHVDGVIFEGTTQTGTFSADAYFGVEIGGNVENTAEGRDLRIIPKMTSYQLQNLTMDTTSDRTQAQAGIEAAVSEWLNAAFTDLLFPAATDDLYAYAQAGGYEGSANLLVVR